jgi:hypothetical protein
VSVFKCTYGYSGEEILSMNLKYLFFITFFASFLSISKAQEIGFPIIRNYTPKEYNNSPQIFGAIQDTRGIFYFGVADGVMEYDGVSWRTISNKKQAYSYDLAIWCKQ